MNESRSNGVGCIAGWFVRSFVIGMQFVQGGWNRFVLTWRGRKDAVIQYTRIIVGEAMRLRGRRRDENLLLDGSDDKNYFLYCIYILICCSGAPLALH
jgi:hypothetical protein